MAGVADEVHFCSLQKKPLENETRFLPQSLNENKKI